MSEQSSKSAHSHAHKHFENLKVERLADSEAVVTGELTLEFLNECRGVALKALNDRTKIDGFRPGNIPENVLVKHVGEMHVLEEVAEVALGNAYGQIMSELKLSPIGRPQVAITKLAPGIPLEFKINVSLEPEFELPDYKKIAKESVGEVEALDVTDAEIDAVLEEIKKRDWSPKLNEGEDLREKVKENLKMEKEQRAKEKKRIMIVEGLSKATEMQVPKVLVEAELEKMVAQFKDDVSRHGMKWDEYMKSINKTEADIREEWKDKALSRVKAELIMLKIAETEKLEPSNEELEGETKHLLAHYKDADPLRVRIYVYQMLKNQKVLEFLENIDK